LNLKKHELQERKKIEEANSSEPPKPELILKTRNPWNHILELDQEVQFPINLILKDKIRKKYQFKKFIKEKRIKIVIKERGLNLTRKKT